MGATQSRDVVEDCRDTPNQDDCDAAVKKMISTQCLRDTFLKTTNDPLSHTQVFNPVFVEALRNTSWNWFFSRNKCNYLDAKKKNDEENNFYEELRTRDRSHLKRNELEYRKELLIPNAWKESLKVYGLYLSARTKYYESLLLFRRKIDSIAGKMTPRGGEALKVRFFGHVGTVERQELDNLRSILKDARRREDDFKAQHVQPVPAATSLLQSSASVSSSSPGSTRSHQLAFSDPIALFYGAFLAFCIFFLWKFLRIICRRSGGKTHKTNKEQGCAPAKSISFKKEQAHINYGSAASPNSYTLPPVPVPDMQFGEYLQKLSTECKPAESPQCGKRPGKQNGFSCFVGKQTGVWCHSGFFLGDSLVDKEETASIFFNKPPGCNVCDIVETLASSSPEEVALDMRFDDLQKFSTVCEPAELTHCEIKPGTRRLQEEEASRFAGKQTGVWCLSGCSLDNSSVEHIRTTV
ncbi:unnamed protein product [Amoebophrya sp. A25]|nr:unnamed protein product [Amoebophrya sp. A25]|eukprot:GSA25T00006829001.1